MNTITIDRIDPNSTKELDRLSAGVAHVVNTIVAEGDNMALAGRMTPEQVREMVQRLGEKGGIFYAEERDHVIAFARLSQSEADPTVAILGVWVLPEARRRGIGMALSRAGIEHARDAGFSRVQGTIPASNEGALSFFSAVGPIAAMEGGGMRYELPV